MLNGIKFSKIFSFASLTHTLDYEKGWHDCVHTVLFFSLSQGEREEEGEKDGGEREWYIYRLVNKVLIIKLIHLWIITVYLLPFLRNLTYQIHIPFPPSIFHHTICEIYGTESLVWSHPNNFHDEGETLFSSPCSNVLVTIKYWEPSKGSKF